MNLFTLAAASLVLSSAAAFAHSDDMTTLPADGDVMETAPEEITFSFDDALRMTRVELIRDDADAEDLDLGDQQSFTTEFAVPLTEVGPGSYLIEWRGLGIDGHPVQGSFSFDVE
ncbi:copper resistance CopC family protein [Gymnodinialimonas ceratoperidinii]|uniref:Copper resistance protein CopC n=1 Tax=Gymnodinialimonas ceratoperidinii TaxID=2856823 RepID=A0A8F6TXF1_9RHOB|nr:copper resistance CopC family protein [Gymnodinialimonas ceratoperidinii]QXT39481.1 copper resistance protein CopC [Gymnodinialimonas ceratoperidinii]